MINSNSCDSPTDNGMNVFSGFGSICKCSTMARIGFNVFNENCDGTTFQLRTRFRSFDWISTKLICLKFSLKFSLCNVIVTQDKLVFNFDCLSIRKFKNIFYSFPLSALWALNSLRLANWRVFFRSADLIGSSIACDNSIFFLSVSVHSFSHKYRVVFIRGSGNSPKH